MAKNGQFKTFNVSDPEYGIKGYAPIDPNLNQECLYRHDRIAISTTDRPDHFTETYSKQFKFFPAAKYNVLHDWSKPEMFASCVGKTRGRFYPEGKGIKMYRMSE
jgi:hypothetical protein